METKINHVGIWVKNLETAKLFYEKYFNARANNMYINEKKKFKSYILTFDGNCKIEIMSKDGVSESKNGLFLGYAHISFSLGSKDNVNLLTEQARKDGYKVASEPRITGDGFYESAIEDPDGNLIELTV